MIPHKFQKMKSRFCFMATFQKYEITLRVVTVVFFLCSCHMIVYNCIKLFIDCFRTLQFLIQNDFEFAASQIADIILSANPALRGLTFELKKKLRIIFFSVAWYHLYIYWVIVKYISGRYQATVSGPKEIITHTIVFMVLGEIKIKVFLHRYTNKSCFCDNQIVYAMIILVHTYLLQWHILHW